MKLGQLLKRRIVFVASLAILLVVLLGSLFHKQISDFINSRNAFTSGKLPSVTTPTIINGELVLPEVLLGDSTANLNKGRLGVLSANLIGVFDSPKDSPLSSPGQAGQAPSPSSGQDPSFGAQPEPKLVAMRIVGELRNLGNKTVDGISPVIRFFDVSGKVVGQKVATVSNGFNFFSLDPKAQTLYDVTVESPPVSDKLEIVIGATSATSSAVFEPLKIKSKTIEVKKAKYEKGGSSNVTDHSEASADASQSGGASSSGQAAAAGSPGGPAGSEGEIIQSHLPEELEYYTVSGSVTNGLKDSVSEITIYTWVKDLEGKVFSWGRQDFRNDLISPGKGIEFKINLLPFKTGQAYASYEVAAWARRYRF